MAGRIREPSSGGFVDTLRQHVLDPLDTADQILEQERVEITAEQEAFDAFAKRLASIDPVPTPHEHQPLRVLDSPLEPGRMDRVRTAYRDTVMAVSHYDVVYGESLVEHVAAEYGQDIATGLHVESPIRFTPAFEERLRVATTQVAQERQQFLTTLDREARSLETARADLTDLLAGLDSTTIPEWYRESFTDRLDAIAQTRQETTRARTVGSHLDDHALCEYLYAEPSWTYPVLTAVTRLWDVVDL